MEKYHVILIEDDPNWINFFKEVVAKSPHNIFDFSYAETLAEAQNIINKEPVILVLLDLMLPDSQAQDTVVWGTRTLSPVIILTTLADEKLMHMAFQHGIEDYLLKDEYDDKVFFHVASRAIRKFHSQITAGLDEMSVKFTELCKKLDGIVDDMNKNENHNQKAL